MPSSCRCTPRPPQGPGRSALWSWSPPWWSACCGSSRTDPALDSRPFRRRPCCAVDDSDRIDLYPVLTTGDVPVGMPDNTIVAGWGYSGQDQGWSGIVGIPATNGGPPTAVIAITAFPAGWDDPSGLPVQPGRRPDVTESRAGDDGVVRLNWSIGDQVVLVAGHDVGLQYELLDHIRPIAAAGSRGGYDLLGPLPGDLVELDPPRHQPPMSTPTIGDDDDSGTLNVSVDTISPLTLLIGGDTDLATASIGGYSGIVATRDDYTDLAFAIATDETVFMSSKVLSPPTTARSRPKDQVRRRDLMAKPLHVTDLTGVGPTTTVNAPRGTD